MVEMLNRRRICPAEERIGSLSVCKRGYGARSKMWCDEREFEDDVSGISPADVGAALRQSRRGLGDLFSDEVF